MDLIIIYLLLWEELFYITYAIVLSSRDCNLTACRAFASSSLSLLFLILINFIFLNDFTPGDFDFAAAASVTFVDFYLIILNP